MFGRTVCFAILMSHLGVATNVFAHASHHHFSGEQKEAQATMKERRAYAEINSAYQMQVKPIFEKKCMACHSSSKIEMPFYFSWPFANQIIRNDIAESKEHINMDGGFPFGGHGTPPEDLEAIKKTVQEGSMPPWRYRILHLGSALTPEEQRIIIEWLDTSLKALEKR